MPTIIEAAEQLTVDRLPVLFIDTCVLLDVIRTPLRKIHHCIQSALVLSELQIQMRCKIVAASIIQQEWQNNESTVMTELERHWAARDQDALAFHEACRLVQISLSFAQPAYQSAGLTAKLRDLAASLLGNAIHLLPSAETKSKATDRTLARVRPAQKGGGLQDCIILEEYLELCRLHSGGVAVKKVFCSTNTKDYEAEQGELHATLANEFDSAGLLYRNALHWAVNELKTP